MMKNNRNNNSSLNSYRSNLFVIGFFFFILAFSSDITLCESIDPLNSTEIIIEENKSNNDGVGIIKQFQNFYNNNRLFILGGVVGVTVAVLGAYVIIPFLGTAFGPNLIPIQNKMSDIVLSLCDNPSISPEVFSLIFSKLTIIVTLICSGEVDLNNLQSLYELMDKIVELLGNMSDEDIQKAIDEINKKK